MKRIFPLLAVVAALSFTGFALATQSSATGANDCCFEGAACCELQLPCCETTQCCDNGGATCCGSGLACCEK